MYMSPTIDSLGINAPCDTIHSVVDGSVSVNKVAGDVVDDGIRATGRRGFCFEFNCELASQIQNCSACSFVGSCAALSKLALS